MDNKLLSANFNIHFLKHFFIGEKVYYQILLYSKDDDSLRVEFSERYSELDKIHEKFREDSKSKNYPKFPPKKFFGSTDEKFLNQRLSSLQAYFSNILTHKEFSQLKTVKLWICEVFKKNYKPPVKSQDKKSDVIEEPRKEPSISQGGVSKVNDSMKSEVIPNPEKSQTSNKKEIQKKWNEIIEAQSKQFIDLSEETQQIIGDEEIIQKEKKYTELIANAKFTSKLFNLPKGDDSNFDYLGMEDSHLEQHHSEMMKKLDSTLKFLNNGISDRLRVDGLITNLI